MVTIMLILKIIGSLIIIASSSLIGCLYGDKYSKRLRNLIYMRNCLQLLETEIMFTATHLPEAFENVYKKGNKNVSYFFKDIKEYLLSNKSNCIYDSFQFACSKSKNNLCLEDEDIEILLSLGKVLGKSDRIDQQKHFKAILTQLDRSRIEAEEKKKKNEKMYKSLGILSGFALVILLI